MSGRVATTRVDAPDADADRGERPLLVDIVEHTPGAPYSGIGRYARELRRNLAPRVETRLTTQVDPPLARFLPFLRHLPRRVRGRRRGSIVHFVEDLGCSQMLWQPVWPSVATSHDLGWLAWPPEASMHRPIDRGIWYLSYLGLKRVDAVIAVSEFSRQVIVERLGIPPERVFAIHSGIDVEHFHPIAGARTELARRYGLDDAADIRYILYVGTEIPRKNLTTLLAALRRLPPNVQLLKVGAPGGARFRHATLQLVERLGLDERVQFFQDVAEQDLPLFYNAADVYMCCSYLEGFGHPVLEAMACGTPVVCSNVASLPEVAANAAMLLPPGDDQAFAEAVTSILEDERIRDDLVLRGIERAAALPWARTAAGVLDVYRLVAESTGRSST